MHVEPDTTATSVPVDSAARRDPEALQSLQKRHCPGYRRFQPGLALNSYSLNTSDKTILARRICMILILLARANNSAWIVVYQLGRSFVGFIVYTILAVLGLFLIMYYLHLIDKRCMEGGVIRCFRPWTTRDFNIFVYVTAAVNLGFVAAAVMSLSQAMGPIWTLLGLLIIGAGWVASWTPEPPSRAGGIA